MKCTCGLPAAVKDGRMTEFGYWRRRKCEGCGTEYTTLEQFCETEKGSRGGNQRQPSQMKINPPPVPKVKAPLNRKAKNETKKTRELVRQKREEGVLKPAKPYSKPAWSRIEALKEKKQLEDEQ